jgi:uncharacterized membrane protein YgdD (TMEM256/DUF423 family)
MIRNKKLAVWGSILLTLSIILGAMGAHAMRDILEEDQLRGYLTATEYLTIHGLAFLILAVMRAELAKPALFIRYGVLIFSGSIYLLSMLSAAKLEFPSALGLITPFGGLLMIAGWIWVTLVLVRTKEHKSSGK